MLTKEECLSALEDMAFVEGFMNLEHMLNYDCVISLKYKVIHRLIEEHFELKRKFKKSVLRYDALLEEYGKFRWNPPLKFEELKENMWVWDNFLKRYFQIWRISEESDIFHYTDNYYNGAYAFEENRFYRKQVDE